MSKKTRETSDLDNLINKIAKEIAGKPLGDALAPGSDSPLAQFIGRVVETALEHEMNEHLGYQRSERADEPRDNTRNGSSSKTLRTAHGDIEINVPRDRKSSFEPQLIPKGGSITNELEQRVLALLEEGMTTRQIQKHLEDIYHTTLSPSTISELAKKLDEVLHEWRTRPLEEFYAIMIVDAIYLKIRGSSGVRSTAAYQVCAYDECGRLEVLGVYIPEDGSRSESASYWRSIFVELKRRGVQDVLYLCMDGLTGLEEAAHMSWPDVSIQPCLVHMVRNSLRYVPSKRKYEAAKDLKAIYRAVNYESGEKALEALEVKWGYDHQISVQWRENLARIRGLFDIGEALRKKISTTNAIENLHSHERRFLKGHKSFPNRESALRHLSKIARKLSNSNTSKRSHRGNWRDVVNELLIQHPDRLPDNWGVVN